MKHIYFHLLESSEHLKPFKNDIIRIAKQAVEKVEKVIPIDNVDILFFDYRDDPFGYSTHDPETGIGGYCPSAHIVQIMFDSKLPNFVESLEKNLIGNIAHELHHALRWRDPGYGKTLLEALVSEGLAGSFEREFLKQADYAKYYDVLSPAMFSNMLHKASLELHNTKYDHNKWFFGYDGSIPNWTGYTLGYQLVTSYIQQHPGEKASTLYSKPAQVFWDSYHSLHNIPTPKELEKEGIVFGDKT